LIIEHEDIEILKFTANTLVQSQSSKALEIAFAYKNTECAKIILSKTKILSDIELMSILGHSKDMGSLLSYIAVKQNISNILSDYVISQKSRDSLIKLINNKNASINPDLLSDLCIYYFNDKELRQLILERILKTKSAFPHLIKRSKPEQLSTIKEFFTKHTPDVIIYSSDHKHFEGIDYFLEEKSKLLKQSHVDELILDNALTNFTLCKMLAYGDLHSFVYGIAQMTHSNFAATEKLFKTEINSDTIPRLLSQCGFESASIKEVIYIFKLIYSVCLEEYLDSEIFRHVMSHKLSLDTSINRSQYIMAIIKDGAK
ncbi:MAG: DUF2336 domain-containing protein, partial [Alphaproteobacteria bacterium]